MPTPIDELVARLDNYRIATDLATDPAFPIHPSICDEAAAALRRLSAPATEDEIVRMIMEYDGIVRRSDILRGERSSMRAALDAFLAGRMG